MSVFITATNASTTDQSRVFKVYEIVIEVIQQVSLHCRTVSFHDFITDHYGKSYIMHLYMYISIVHMFIRTISLVHVPGVVVLLVFAFLALDNNVLS